MQRVQRLRSFNNSVSKRSEKMRLLEELRGLIERRGMDFNSAVQCDPTISARTWRDVLENRDEMFSKPRLENMLRSLNDCAVAA